MKKYILLLFLFCAYHYVFAQNKKITGVVSDATSKVPLPGVSILIKGSTTGTQSNSKGEYSIEASPQNTLIFRFLGYTEQEVLVGNSTQINISLKEAVSSLNDVVIVGYGTQVRKDILGAQTSIKFSEVEDIPIASLESAMQGKAPGVFINSGSGKLGQAMQIRVRGISSVSASNQPLFVVDGVPIVTNAMGSYTEADNPLSAINPDDIDNLEILKDAASAAIYGSRASNGVVLITTKKGKEGSTSFDLNYSDGFSNPTKRGKFLNSTQYRELLTASVTNIGEIPGSYNNMSEFWEDWTGTDDWDKSNDSDWVNAAFRTGYLRQYGASVSGGNEKTKYLISGNHSKNKGIIIGNEYIRTGGRISLDHKVSDIFSVGGSFNMARINNYRLNNDNAFSNPLQLNALPPIQAIRNADGSLNNNTVYYNNLLDIENGSNLSQTYRTFSNAYANLKLTPELILRSEFGFDLNNLEEELYLGSKTLDGGDSGGYGFSYYSKSINTNSNNTITYSKVFNDVHDFSIMGGFTFQNTQFRYSYVEGKGFPSDLFTKIASAATKSDGTSSETAYSFISYLARLNYKYNDRYLLSASVRTDGSSRFGKNKRYGTFPAVSLGWIASEEDFIKDSNWLSFLKLRGSFGLTGNAEIGNFNSRTLYSGVNYAGTSGTLPNQLGDPNLTWENTNNLNIGLDWGLFKDRITGSIDLYKKKTTDLLLNVPIPATSGFTSITQNIGDLENKGLEISLNTKNFVGAFRWSTSFNISFNKNKILRLAGQPIFPGGRYLGRIEEGKPYGFFYGKAYAGVDPSNGDALYYVDENRTATTNSYSAAKDQQIGDPNPKFFGGFGNQFSYQGFDLDVQTQFVSGNDLYNAAGGFQSGNGDYFDNQTLDQLDYWKTPGQVTNIPQPRFDEGNGTRASSRYVQKGSYFRVKSVVLGYNLPKAFISKYKFQKVRLFASALNLFTFTKYTGYDPEINTTFAGAVQLGHDFYTPPQARTITFGINIGL